MVDAWILLAAFDFVGPGFTTWFWIFRLPGEDWGHSLVAAGGLSVFLVPAVSFILNRSTGYPLDLLGTTGIALAIILFAALWRTFLRERFAPLLRHWIH